MRLSVFTMYHGPTNHSLERGHLNYPEASHNVLVRYSPKDKYLHNIHYMLSTNIASQHDLAKQDAVSMVVGSVSLNKTAFV